MIIQLLMNRPSIDTEYEKRRLSALERYRILDTEAEKAFDDMALLAARVCRAPMSVVSFIDSSRQWYKAKFGSTTTEVPIESTFCQHTIATPEHVLAVSDATLDARFQSNASVVGEPGIRYYIGAPIVTADGYAIGTVCVIDYKVREVDPEDVRALAAVARQVLAQLDLRMHIMKLEEHALKQQEVRRALQEATQAKSFFLANMSHEIRSPLTSIIGFSEMLRDGKSLAAPESHDAVQSIHRNSTHLLQLVNDILDYSKIEAGRLRPELTNFPLTALCADIRSFVGNRAIEKGIDFKVLPADDLPPVLYSDVTRLRQILFNLIGNAIKFTDHGSVTLRIEKSREEGFTFTVQDTGIGIPKQARDQLFQPFTQAEESTTRRFGGTGLGLAISKKLVELLSGNLSAESIEGKGSSFSFTIPEQFCRQGELSQNSPKIAADNNAENTKKEIKALVAEDFEENRLFLGIIFKKAGIKPVFAVNGADAVLKALEEDFDIVFMDIQMPVLDGMAATQQLLEKGFKKPIIALTATSQENLQQKLSEKGFSGYLGKPFRNEDLQKLLKKHT